MLAFKFCGSPFILKFRLDRLFLPVWRDGLMFGLRLSFDGKVDKCGVHVKPDVSVK